MGLIETLEALDQDLFLYLNGIHHPVADFLMKWITYKYTWIPAYAVVLGLLFRKFGWKHMLLIIPAIAILVLLTDQISYHGFKENFQRYRPCHNLEIQQLVHLVVDRCGGKHGFLSGHSTNAFGMAVFLGMLFRHKAWWWGLLIWASLVAYSRVYVGVHYPADIAAGAVLGLVLAVFVMAVLNLARRQTGFPTQ